MLSNENRELGLRNRYIKMRVFTNFLLLRHVANVCYAVRKNDLDVIDLGYDLVDDFSIEKVNSLSEHLHPLNGSSACLTSVFEPVSPRLALSELIFDQHNIFCVTDGDLDALFVFCLVNVGANLVKRAHKCSKH
jgi:hypothetical protein